MIYGPKPMYPIPMGCMAAHAKKEAEVTPYWMKAQQAEMEGRTEEAERYRRMAEDAERKFYREERRSGIIEGILNGIFG